MFVNNTQQSEVNCLSLESIIKLAKNNYFEAASYFRSELTSQFDIFSFESQTKRNINEVTIPYNVLEQLYFILKQTNTILLQKFNDQNLIYPHNQYSFLRKMWSQHSHRYQTQESLQDRFDTLNKIICMIKLRTRKLTGQCQKKYTSLWNQQIHQCIDNNIWDHPFFEKMNKNISSISLKCQQMYSKIIQITEQKEEYLRKNKQIEGKLINYKEKNKKVQRQMFQLAKKKAELQKQLIQKNYSNHNTTNKIKQQTRINNKQNQQNADNKQAQFILLLKQDEQKKFIESIDQTPRNNPSLRQKYRHAKNITRKSIAYVSPNTSIDSIKNVRFQRSSKKLLIKGQ